LSKTSSNKISLAAVSQTVSELGRGAQASEAFRVGYQHLLDRIDQKRVQAGKRVYAERRAAEIQFTTIYKDITTYLDDNERG
jgi:hypothetical protein